MTLCIAWREQDEIHFLSDSRLTIAQNSYADVAIKILSVPYCIYSPTDESGNKKTVHEGELGMCFAGSAVNSLFIKESIVEVIKTLQFIPGATEVSMANIAKVIFKAYKVISKEICSTSIGQNGIAELIFAGFCPEKRTHRAFKFSTSNDNTHKYVEVLENHMDYLLLGSGKEYALSCLGTGNVNSQCLLSTLKQTIEDEKIDGVGGNIQYGKCKNNKFLTYGIIEYSDIGVGVHYWRGFLDLNSEEFIDGSDDLFPSYQYIDPFAPSNP